jgi:hypothetical protein
VENTLDRPATPITRARARRAIQAEIAEIRRDTDRLFNLFESPEYVQLSVRLTEGMGLTADQRIDFAGDMYDFAESRGMSMSLAMCEAFFEHIEARALAAASAIVLAFRRKTLS